MMAILLFAAALAGDPATAAATAAKPQVTLETSKGTIVLELYPDKAPKTVENFLAYVKAGHYAGTVFHRVIPGFMVQGGGMTATGQQKATRAPIQNEADNGLKNDRGTIAMARTNEPHSASSQFFINTVNNDFLNFKSKDVQGWGYCVFGKVTSGMDVVDAISAIGSRSGQPSEQVVIKSASVK